jgi:hypothetical protein
MINNFMQLNECQFFIFNGVPEKEISFYKPEMSGRICSMDNMF